MTIEENHCPICGSAKIRQLEENYNAHDTIIVDGKVYRAKASEEWPITIQLSYDDFPRDYCNAGEAIFEIGIHAADDATAILAACFDEMETDIWDDYDSEGFTLDRLTGKK